MKDGGPSNKLFWGAILGPYALVTLWVAYQEGTLLQAFHGFAMLAIALAVPVVAFLYWPDRKK